ncbi:MAG: terminase small subunit [Firmicutes bacterium]|nr:terminase small subunit [Bacillota bacterium]
MANESGLTDRQERFVLEYLRNGGNGTEAANAAGYSAKSAAVQASRLLTDAKVLAYKRAQAREVYKSLGITPEQIGLELWSTYKRCAAAVEHLSWDSEQHAWVPDGTYVFDSRGATRALELLGKMQGAFRERVEVDPGPEALKVLTLAQKKERLTELLRAADGDD